jgi:carboxymethylenebutenolidase
MLTFRSGGRDIRLAAFEPQTPPPGSKLHPAILLLHGAGGNVGFWLDRVAPLVNRFGVAVYAAHYFDRTGTERATPAHLADGLHVPQWLATIGDALTSVAARPTIDRERIALLGISLGAFLSLALATQVPAGRIRSIVEISGGLIPPFEHSATSAFPPTLIIHGEGDTVVPVSHAHRLAARLKQLNVEHQQKLLPEEGHWFSAAAQTTILQAVAPFLARHLLSGR